MATVLPAPASLGSPRLAAIAGGVLRKSNTANVS
jgi:hypothetical protein